VLGDLFHGHSRRPGIGHRRRGGARLQVLKAEGQGKGGKNGGKQVKNWENMGKCLKIEEIYVDSTVEGGGYPPKLRLNHIKPSNNLEIWVQRCRNRQSNMEIVDWMQG